MTRMEVELEIMRMLNQGNGGAALLDHDQAQREEIAQLREALEAIITYRNKVGALGFQLEKMDYFIAKAKASLAWKEAHGHAEAD